MTAADAHKPMIDPINWRADMLKVILKGSAILGSVVYVPSMYMALKVGLYGLAFVDTLSIGTVIALLVFTRVSYTVRATMLCAVLYFLGVGLLVAVGPISQIYLFAFSIATTLLLGLRPGLIATVVNAITLLVLGSLGIASIDMVAHIQRHGFVGWFVTTLNFVLINAMLTVAIGTVLKALEAALTREISVGHSLNDERNLLRTLVNNLPDGVFTKDMQGRYASANAATLKVLGVENEAQLRGKTVFDVLPEHIATLFHVDDLRVLSGERILNREERNTDRSGKTVWFLTTKVPLRDAAGNIVGLIGISRDIAERRAIEAERDSLLAQLQMQIERMPLAYVLTDKHFTFTRLNPAAEKLFGYSEAEVVNKCSLDLIVPTESRGAASGVFDEIRAGNMNVHGVYANRTKSGRTVMCEWQNTPMFDENGEFAGVLALAHDVTERISLEGQLRQAHKMEAVGQLAGGVAHDFNNLLTVILGYSEALMDEKLDDTDVRESAEAIREAGRRAAALTRQLLAYSRQTILQPKVLELNPIVTQIGTMLRRLIGEDIVFTTVLDPNISRVRVDPGHLDQVLMNLAVNARDAMPQGGHLTIETRNVELSEDYVAQRPGCKAGPHVMMAISDTGVGMPADVMSRIFEPFYTTKGVHSGTGLGLAMVFGIVQQSGGTIHVYSEPTLGTTFKIYFPAVAGHVSSGATPIVKQELGGTETVLLVEDEASVRRHAVLTLSARGYTVLAATDGEDALRVLDAHADSIDLLLTDVVMPRSSGPELAQAVRLQFPDVKVLFMSGYTDDAVIRHGLLHAEMSFIQKPYSPVDLAQKVRHVLDQESLQVRV